MKSIDTESRDLVEATLLKNVSLKPYNTLRLDAYAALMAYPHSFKGVEQLVDQYSNEKEIIVIGKGSNTLFTQKKYSEDTLYLNLKFLDKVELRNDELYVECGATLSNMVWYGVENGLVGYEFLEDIPGTVGGAILMNAGTYKNYIGDLITSVTYFDKNENNIITRQTREEDFGRRQSFWTNTDSILLSCTLKTYPGDYLEALEKVQCIKKNRFMKQPRNFPSAGSVFVRPKVDLKDMVVWELLEKVGLRGYKYGGAAFSKKHPGFIINLGNGTYEDIIYLINFAKKKVYDEFGVELTVEWKKV